MKSALLEDEEVSQGDVDNNIEFIRAMVLFHAHSTSQELVPTRRASRQLSPDATYSTWRPYRFEQDNRRRRSASPAASSTSGHSSGVRTAASDISSIDAFSAFEFYHGDSSSMPPGVQRQSTVKISAPTSPETPASGGSRKTKRSTLLGSRQGFQFCVLPKRSWIWSNGN